MASAHASTSPFAFSSVCLFFYASTPPIALSPPPLKVLYIFLTTKFTDTVELDIMYLNCNAHEVYIVR